MARRPGDPAITSEGSTRKWRRLRLATLERDGWRCQVPVNGRGEIDPSGRPCLLPADTADHIVPRQLGGADVLDNLRAACRQHNRAKSGALDGDARPPQRPGGDRRKPSGRTWHW